VDTDAGERPEVGEWGGRLRRTCTPTAKASRRPTAAVSPGPGRVVIFIPSARPITPARLVWGEELAARDVSRLAKVKGAPQLQVALPQTMEATGGDARRLDQGRVQSASPDGVRGQGGGHARVHGAFGNEMFRFAQVITFSFSHLVLHAPAPTAPPSPHLESGAFHAFAPAQAGPRCVLSIEVRGPFRSTSIVRPADRPVRSFQRKEGRPWPPADCRMGLLALKRTPA
jgi:hypothetical protein